MLTWKMAMSRFGDKESRSKTFQFARLGSRTSRDLTRDLTNSNPLSQDENVSQALPIQNYGSRLRKWTSFVAIIATW